MLRQHETRGDSPGAPLGRAPKQPLLPCYPGRGRVVYHAPLLGPWCPPPLRVAHPPLSASGPSPAVGNLALRLAGVVGYLRLRPLRSLACPSLSREYPLPGGTPLPVPPFDQPAPYEDIPPSCGQPRPLALVRWSVAHRVVQRKPLSPSVPVVQSLAPACPGRSAPVGWAARGRCVSLLGMVGPKPGLPFRCPP
jgi:hypothetical protein